VATRPLILQKYGQYNLFYTHDGNQTLIKTATGVWSVTYNGENRPVLWECGSTNIVMKFDRMGRRVEYVDTVNGSTNAHHRFVYDGYICIQRFNAASRNAIDLVIGWDPSEPVACYGPERFGGCVSTRYSPDWLKFGKY
jgi:hypothetical protein